MTGFSLFPPARGYDGLFKPRSPVSIAAEMAGHARSSRRFAEGRRAMLERFSREVR